jgi:hypothetical protein
MQALSVRTHQALHTAARQHPPWSSSVSYTQPKASSLLMTVRTTCASSYFALQPSARLLLSSIAAPLERKMQLGTSMLRSQPGYLCICVRVCVCVCVCARMCSVRARPQEACSPHCRLQSTPPLPRRLASRRRRRRRAPRAAHQLLVRFSWLTTST